MHIITEGATVIRDNRASGVRESRSIIVADVSWPRVEQCLRDGACAVLPIGAASKEHGYHLPLATDYLQAQWIAGQLVQKRQVAAWPVLSYGYYPVFVDYPGSNSLERDTFMRVVGEVLSGLAQAGAARIVIANTGISTIEPLEKLLAGNPTATPTKLINVYSGPAFAQTSERLQEQHWGGHADEIETSMMLAIAPELVDMSVAEGNSQRIVRGMFNRDDPLGSNYTPSGVNGDPLAASAAKGEALLAALMDDVLAQFDEFHI